MMTNRDRSARLAAIKLPALKDLIERMRATSDTSKAVFTLAELLAEQHRREPVGFLPTVETAQTIIRLVRESPTGLTTYGAIWNAFRPDEPWHMHTSRQQVNNALDRVNFYCIRHGLPQIVTLVVNGTEKALTDQAKSNIFNASRERGMDVGLDRDAFIDKHQEMSRAIALETLPAADF
ncbi:hypothetical protein DM806_13695 [Sphingobium lactosutens]|uniref:hypothetical protein n=1 Tax=Sphingobium lactosutens TaxID=522773 RepID=UPI0015BB73CC|nr:hypothetical protein [Sphingobium lactosutens]NWK96694.1 hypothetical protein [Sphingobium lactosutens]